MGGREVVTTAGGHQARAAERDRGLIARAPFASRVGGVVLALWLYVALVAAWLLGQWGGEELTEAVSAWGIILPPLVAVGLIVAQLRTDRMTGHRRRGWVLLALACATEALASAVYASLAAANAESYPSVADVVYIPYYPFVAGACLMFFRDLGGTFRNRRVWIDIATLVVGFGCALWFVVFAPLASTSGRDVLQSSVTAGYGLGNGCLMIAAALLFTQVADWRSERAMLLVIAAIATTLLADLWWIAAEVRGGYEIGALIDLGYYLVYAFLASAILCERGRPRGARDALAEHGNAYSFLPVLAVLLALVLVLEHEVGGTRLSSPVITGIVVFGAFLLLCRQLGVRREIAALHDSLAARRADERLTELVRCSADVFLVVDAHDRLAYVSPASGSVLGREPFLLLGQAAAQFLGEQHAPRVRAFLGHLRGAANARAGIELEIALPDEERRVILVAGTNQSALPSIRGIVLTLRDITEHKRLEEQLRSLAFYDSLTLLANRTLFADRVHHAMARLQDGLTPAVIFIDLDNFKTINDSLGHGAGDRLLRTCAQRIVHGTRTGDTVARLGGDEFAVLIDHVASAEATLAAARHVLAVLDAPIDVDGRALRVSASLGVAPATAGMTSEQLLRNADAAMYSAKAAGKGRVALFQPEMLTAARRRLEIEEELVAALPRDEFLLYYQPIVDLRNGNLVGIEALLRWQHPTRGFVSPGDFVAVAEDSGLIVPLTQWVLRRACADARKLQGSLTRGDGLRVAVNISGRHLQVGDLVADVQAALEAAGLPAQCLLLEVTESLLLQESRDVELRLAQLKALGVRLALDDFGTGYSSLAYLHRFPLDILKIDRSFVQRLGVGGSDEELSASALAKAILSLADALGLDTVAEGVEDDAQRDALLGLGCRTAQGYLFGKPMPLAELLDTPAVRRRGLLVENLTGPVEFTATGRYRTLAAPRSASEG